MLLNRYSFEPLVSDTGILNFWSVRGMMGVSGAVVSSATVTADPVLPDSGQEVVVGVVVGAVSGSDL